jgi:hypothetical protein
MHGPVRSKRHNLAKVGVEGSNPFAGSRFCLCYMHLEGTRRGAAFFSQVWGNTGVTLGKSIGWG